LKAFSPEQYPLPSRGIVTSDSLPVADALVEVNLVWLAVTAALYPLCWRYAELKGGPDVVAVVL
jgi:hypothetical protein